MSHDLFRRYIDIVTESAAHAVTEMDKSQPSHGRDGHVSHSTYGSRDKEGSDYFKGKERPAKPITVKQMEKDALDILKKQGLAEGSEDKFAVPDQVESLVKQHSLYNEKGYLDLFAKLTGKPLDRAEIEPALDYASKLNRLLHSIRMRSEWRGTNPKQDQELIALANQWMDLFNKSMDLFNKSKNSFGDNHQQGVAEGTKSLADYIAESERAYSQPVPGDWFAINIREETLFETWVCDETPDGIVIYADDAGLALLERYGYLGEGISEGHDFEIDSDEDSVDVVDQGEYDQEGDMAKDDLATIVRAARRLTGMLDDNDNLPEWVQAKITKAADYVDTAADYIESNRERDGEQGSLNEGQYEMMKHNGHVKKFHANNDADAIRFAKDHGAKSLIRLKRGAPPEKVFEQDMSEGKRSDRYHIVGKDGKPADLASYPDRASAEQVRDKKYPGAKVQQVGPRGKVKGVTEGFDNDTTGPATWNGHKVVANRKTSKGSFLILQNKNDSKYEIHKQNPSVVGGLEFMSVHKTPEEMQAAFRQLTGVDESKQGMAEAKYQGREVPLGKPMKGDVKKSKVYVRGPKGNVVKVNFGQKGMKIKKNIPGRRKNFRARHNCANPGPRWKARYWSCRAW